MNNPLQNINAISPMAGEEKTAPKDPIQAEYETGKALLEKNELGSAAASLHNALVGFEEQSNERGIANAANQLGNLCLLREEYAAALKHFSRAEEICNHLQDPMSLQALARQFVKAHMGAGQYDKAIERCLDLLDLYEANNNPQGAVEMMELMAEIYIASGDRRKAADAFRTIASIHTNFRHKTIAARFLEKAKQLEEGI